MRSPQTFPFTFLYCFESSKFKNKPPEIHSKSCSYYIYAPNSNNPNSKNLGKSPFHSIFSFLFHFGENLRYRPSSRPYHSYSKKRKDKKEASSARDLKFALPGRLFASREAPTADTQPPSCLQFQQLSALKRSLDYEPNLLL